MKADLARFIPAHDRDFEKALFEIRSGKKQSHWMWYIFPQLKGLGHSTTSDYYGIRDLDEARAFLQDKYLGTHLIEISNALLRGNHERELWPLYELANLPDILVLKGQNITFYLTHAGMIQEAFDMINMDIKNSPEAYCQAYALDNNITCYDAPFRQIIWSRRGLYSQRSRYHVWPSEESLRAAKACIIHGHTPFSQLKQGHYFSYGDKMLLWEKQRVWFAEDLQSFDIDSNVKGKFDADDPYRGLSCVCLEIVDEIASKNNGFLTRKAIRESDNFVFAAPYTPNGFFAYNADLSPILKAKPEMKRIVLAADGNPQIYSLE